MLYWVFRTGRKEQMDFNKGTDRLFVGMRGELSKYQLWLRREGNQIIVCALSWQVSSSAVFYLQRFDSLRIHRGRHSLKNSCSTLHLVQDESSCLSQISGDKYRINGELDYMSLCWVFPKGEQIIKLQCN